MLAQLNEKTMLRVRFFSVGGVVFAFSACQWKSEVRVSVLRFQRVSVKSSEVFEALTHYLAFHHEEKDSSMISLFLSVSF